MFLSKSELLVLEQVSKGIKTISDIAFAIKKSSRQIYTIVNSLSIKGIVNLKNKSIHPINLLHVSLLLQLLSETPNSHLILSNSKISVLTSILTPKDLMKISSDTNIKKSSIYNILKLFFKRNIVKKNSKGYVLNKSIWPLLYDFLKSLKDYESQVDMRVPIGSKIYYKNKKEILFSSKEKLSLTKTAFSAYETYGIKLLLTKNYYFLPSKKLSKNEIFKHSIFIVKKDFTIKNLIFLSLFYIKFRKSFSIKDEIILNINKVLNGEIITNYPSLAEIKLRAKIYDIVV